LPTAVLQRLVSVALTGTVGSSKTTKARGQRYRDFDFRGCWVYTTPNLRLPYDNTSEDGREA
jgi:hypothetical protein